MKDSTGEIDTIDRKIRKQIIFTKGIYQRSVFVCIKIIGQKICGENPEKA